MFSVINTILLVLFSVLSLKIFSRRFNKRRILQLPNGKPYRINKNMYYLIFVVCTAPFFLGELSLLKYFVYFITLLILLYSNRIQIKNDGIVKSYFVFFIWSVISLMWSIYPYNGFTMVVKLLLPIVSLWLGYSAIERNEDFYFFAKYTTKWAVIYSFFIGGISAVFMPALYFFLNNIFITYAGLADYYTSIFPLCFALAWIMHQKKKNYAKAVLLLVSTTLEAVRTGLGGMTIGGTVFTLFKNRAKALPAVFFIGAIAIGILLYVPSVNQKFFKGGDGVTASELSGKSFDDIQSNGREEMWENLLYRFYEPSPITGSGLGTATGFMKDKVRGYTESMIVLIHSDYVQILCDTGQIGLGLFILFVITVLIKTGTAAISSRNLYTKISAIVAASSLAGIVFSMGFDNVLSHSMTSLINPFIFIGFFLKFKDLERR